MRGRAAALKSKVAAGKGKLAAMDSRQWIVGRRGGRGVEEAPHHHLL